MISSVPKHTHTSHTAQDHVYIFIYCTSTEVQTKRFKEIPSLSLRGSASACPACLLSLALSLLVEVELEELLLELFLDDLELFFLCLCLGVPADSTLEPRLFGWFGWSLGN